MENFYNVVVYWDEDDEFEHFYELNWSEVQRLRKKVEYEASRMKVTNTTSGVVRWYQFA